MIEALLSLPANQRSALIKALETGLVGPPYAEASLRSALLGDQSVAGVSKALIELEARGVSGSGVAFALELAGATSSAVNRPDLVWSGPNVSGLHARDTRRVYDELIKNAEHSLWISSFVYFNGQNAFSSLAKRMDATEELDVCLLLNIRREPNNKSDSSELVYKFTEKLWKDDWPGERRPNVYYDPRSLDPTQKGVLHAKAVVADGKEAFVTSANLTEAAFEHNIEVGVLTRDPGLAASLVRHFSVLIEKDMLLPLPGV